MEDNRYNFRHRSIIGPFIFITVGVVFLLNNLGLVPIDIWQQIWKFWPFIIILIGIQTLLGNSSKREPVLVIAGIIFILLVVLYSLSIENQTVHQWVEQYIPWLQLPSSTQPFQDFNDNWNNMY